MEKTSMEMSLDFIDALIKKDYELAEQIALEYEQGSQLDLFGELQNGEGILANL